MDAGAGAGVRAGVVVVGGGFAGFWAAAAARRVGGGDLSVCLMAPGPSLVMRPRLYEAHPETLAVDLAPLLDTLQVRFVAGAAVDLDIGRQIVTMASGDEVRFERLVVATGSVMRRPPLEGAGEAHSIDTQIDAIRLDHRLAEIAAQAGADSRPVVAVVGAGFTGIELALELRDRMRIHRGPSLGQRLRVVLIDRAGVVGHELGPGPRPAIESALRDCAVELHLGVQVRRLAADRVEFADGGAVDADAVVLATGLVAAPFAAKVPGACDDAGRVIVDAFLRAPAAPQVFVAGDAASADTGDGHRALASCQHALQLGRVAGHNAACDLLGLPLAEYQQLRYVTCLDLGRSGAVLTRGWDREVTLTGAAAKERKVMINTTLIYPPPQATADELLRQSALDPAER